MSLSNRRKTRQQRYDGLPNVPRYTLPQLSTETAIENIRNSQHEKHKKQPVVLPLTPVASTHTPPPQHSHSTQLIAQRLNLPLSQTNTSTKKRKPKDQSAGSVAELLKNDNAERSLSKNRKTPSQATPQPLSFQSPIAAARRNGYNARRQSNLDEIATQEEGQYQHRKRR